jgi:hypothetical protein
MFLRSFWYHFHADLITTSTAGVCYYPQDMGALTKLDISSNRIPLEQKGRLQHICMAGGIELAI